MALCQKFGLSNFLRPKNFVYIRFWDRTKLLHPCLASHQGVSDVQNVIFIENENEMYVRNEYAYATNYGKTRFQNLLTSTLHQHADNIFLNSSWNKTLFLKVNNFYCQIMSLFVKVLKTFDASLYYNIPLRNSSKTVVSSSYSSLSRVIPYKEVYNCRVQNYSLGNCVGWASNRLYYTTDAAHINSKQKPSYKKDDSASQKLMLQAKERLPSLVSGMFSGRYNYGFLNNNIILENNLFGKNKTYRGPLSYALELLKIRLRIHAQFSKALVEIKDISVLEHDRLVRIQWALKAVDQTKVFSIVRRMGFIKPEDNESLEACSQFLVDKDGFVLKHRIDRVVQNAEKKDNQEKN